jgi:hypothetical protein
MRAHARQKKILRKKKGHFARCKELQAPCQVRRHLVALCYVEIGDMRLLIGGGDPP